jgi:hypothetical protein
LKEAKLSKRCWLVILVVFGVLLFLLPVAVADDPEPIGSDIGSVGRQEASRTVAVELLAVGIEEYKQVLFEASYNSLTRAQKYKKYLTDAENAAKSGWIAVTAAAASALARRRLRELREVGVRIGLRAFRLHSGLAPLSRNAHQDRQLVVERIGVALECRRRVIPFRQGPGARAELFPSRIRATAQGFCYNFGRAVSALAPFVIGALADRHGIGSALALTSAFFVAAGLLILLLPETRGEALQ